MKSKGGILLFGVLAVVLIVMMKTKTQNRQYNWAEDYFHYSSEPFSCAVFDSIMANSLPKGYSVDGRTLFQLAHDLNADTLYTILYVKNVFYYDQYDFDAINKLLDQGHYVLIAANSSLGKSDSGGAYDDVGQSESFDFDIDCRQSHVDYNVKWVADDQLSKREYDFTGKSEFVRNTDFIILQDDAEYDILAVNNEQMPMAVSKQIGRGRLLVTSMPILYSNYGILDSDMRELGMRIMSYVASRPVIRCDWSMVDEIESNGNESDGKESPLKYLYANPPLRWALLLLLLTALLFMLFTARRRQRVIPVVKQPADQTMALALHVGTLYYEQHDNIDLLGKKYGYFTEQLRREIGIDIDIDDKARLNDELAILANITGIKRDALAADVEQLKDALEAERLSDKRLKQLIGIINNIIAKL